MKARLSTLLIACSMVISLGPASLVFGLCYSQAWSRLRKEITTQLRTIADGKARQLETYIRGNQKDITALAHSPTIVATLRRLQESPKGMKQSTLESTGPDCDFTTYLAVHRREM